MIDWSPRSRISNRCSRSTAGMPQTMLSLVIRQNVTRLNAKTEGEDNVEKAALTLSWQEFCVRTGSAS
jgi:hypothetical protein